MADVEPAGGGRWRFSYKDPATGRRRYKVVPAGISTKGGAREYQRAFLVKLARREVGLEPDDPNPHTWNVEGLVKWWLENLVDHKLASAPETRSRVENHVFGSKLGQVLLEQVKPADVERWLFALGEKKLSPQTINHCRGHVSRAFNVAIKLGHFVGANPVARTDKLKMDNTVLAWLTKAEVRRVLEMAFTLQPQWASLYACAFYTGMRKGELFALRWDDVDMARGLIVVRRSHERMTTKSRKGRVIDVPDELRPWLDHQKKLGCALVFPNPKGKRWAKATKIEDRFARVLIAAGVKRPLRFHDTRHTFASLYLMQHRDIAALQEILGHASIETTRQRYGHLSRAHVRAQLKKFTMADPVVAPAPARPDAVRAQGAK